MSVEQMANSVTNFLDLDLLLFFSIYVVTFTTLKIMLHFKVEGVALREEERKKRQSLMQ